MERKYSKATALAVQWKQDEVSMRRSMVELCSTLPNMQLEPDASIIENVQKVVVCAQVIVVRMDMVEAKYKAKIEELEKRDLTKKLKTTAKELVEKIVH